jgi:flavin reductase (DIM6/NTAB) family NADH-FMN oxidoreductase RutF
MSQWVTGVTVVTTEHNGIRYGMTVSSFNSLSLNPPLVTVFIGKQHSTLDAIQQSGCFAVNLLAESQLDVGKTFAGMTTTPDRFAGLTLTTAESGAPLLVDSLAWMDCKLHTTYDGGDHVMVVGEVLATASDGARAPLLYGRRSWGTFTPTRRRFVHIVMMRLKENTPENAARMRDALYGMVGKVPQIRALEVGVNVVVSDRAYDIALTVTLDSQEDMEAYQVHPEHQRVLNEIVRPLISGSVAADYDIEA